MLTSTENHDGIKKLIGMVRGENNGSIARNIVSSHHLHFSKEYRNDRMKEYLDSKKEQCLELGYEYIDNQQYGNGGNV